MFFRRKEAPEESVRPKKKEEFENEQWDKKKIFVTLFFAIVAILAASEIKGVFFPGKPSVLGEKAEPSPITRPDIKPPSLNVASEVGLKLEDIKKNIGDLTPEEIATTSPQIQKVIQDIQGIKNLPASQAREMCLKICGGI